jgi:hypothetical protein
MKTAFFVILFLTALPTLADSIEIPVFPAVPSQIMFPGNPPPTYTSVTLDQCIFSTDPMCTEEPFILKEFVGPCDATCSLDFFRDSYIVIASDVWLGTVDDSIINQFIEENLPVPAPEPSTLTLLLLALSAFLALRTLHPNSRKN